MEKISGDWPDRRGKHGITERPDANQKDQIGGRPPIILETRDNPKVGKTPYDVSNQTYLSHVARLIQPFSINELKFWVDVSQSILREIERVTGLVLLQARYESACKPNEQQIPEYILWLSWKKKKGGGDTSQSMRGKRRGSVEPLTSGF